MFGMLRKQRSSPFCHDLILLPKLSSDLHERNVGESFAQNKQHLGLLLKFCFPGINPELMMECKFVAHQR